MSQEKGQYYVLLRAPQTSPQVFVVVACLNSFKPTINNKVIDGTSMCGPDFLVGFPNNTIPIQGFVDFNSSDISGPSLLDAANDGTVYDWRIEPADTPATGDVRIDCSGALSNYDQNFAKDEMVSFSATIQVKNYFTQTIL